MQNKNEDLSFEQITDRMRLHGMKLPAERIHIKLKNSDYKLKDAISYFLQTEDRQTQWLPEYDEVSEWLSDNKGRGLFLYGNCGRGKTLLCQYVLPALLLGYCGKVVSIYNVQEMNNRLDEVLNKPIVSVDDIGTEEVSNVYGNRRLAFAELMDVAEKQGKLVIISSNLDVDDIRHRYGDRTLDRIKSTTRRILFQGESLRG